MPIKIKKIEQLKTVGLLPAVLIVFFIGASGSPLQSGDGPRVYCTGTVLEVDRCASAWLIKRFVDSSAVFVFLSEEELLDTTAIPFDTATATLRRSHRLSTFACIRDHYSISDMRVDGIAKLIDDIEINFWNRKFETKSRQFEQEITQLITESVDNQEALNNCLHYLDIFEP